MFGRRKPDMDLPTPPGEPRSNFALYVLLAGGVVGVALSIIYQMAAVAP